MLFAPSADNILNTCMQFARNAEKFLFAAVAVVTVLFVAVVFVSVVAVITIFFENSHKITFSMKVSRFGPL